MAEMPVFASQFASDAYVMQAWCTRQGVALHGKQERRIGLSGLSRSGVAILIGGLVGLALGILVSVTTDLPLAPELGAILGVLVGWLSQRERA